LNEAHAKLLLKRFDNDRDDKLSYLDVCEFFMPKDKVLQKMLAERVSIDNQNITRKLNNVSARHLRKLFHKLL